MPAPFGFQHRGEDADHPGFGVDLKPATPLPQGGNQPDLGGAALHAKGLRAVWLAQGGAGAGAPAQSTAARGRPQTGAGSGRVGADARTETSPYHAQAAPKGKSVATAAGIPTMGG